MLDSERASRGPLDYEVVTAFTDFTGAYRRIGDTLSLDPSLGELLCRKGYLKDVTARVADTIAERVEDLESTTATHTSQIAAVTASDALKATEADLELAENRVTTLEGDVATAESDIDSLEGRATTLEGDVATAESDIDSLEGRATTLEGDVATAESDIDSLEGRMTTVEGDIADHEARITTIETTLGL